MSEHKYQNQHGIFNPDDQRLKITIIGVGSSGSFIALTIAKMGFKDIEIIDFDIVELHNIPNQFYRMKDIGRPKVEALKEIIEEFTGISVTFRNSHFENKSSPEDFDMNRLHLICVDNVETRRYIYQQLKDFPLFIIDGGLGGEEFHTLVLRMDNTEHQKIYENFISTEGKDIPCGMRNVIYTILSEAAEICNIVKRLDKKEQVPEQLRRDMRSYNILHTPIEEENLIEYNCLECGISLNLDEEKESGICVSCENESK